MQQYLPLLEQNQLFSGIRAADIPTMLDCLQGTVARYPKRETIFRSGSVIHSVAFLAEGAVLIQKEDYWGKLNILAELKPGDLFGAAYMVPAGVALCNDVVAKADSTVLFFDLERVLTACPSACPFHTRLIQNLFYVLAEKSRSLVQKLDCLSRRSIREKLLAYLSGEAQRQASNTFSIPFNRQQLADYLSVDRSALSSELGRLRDAGLLTFHKNRFTLLGRADD